MKKTLVWTMAGLSLATICGLAGLHHLSASFVTLTVFFSVPALAVLCLDASFTSPPRKRPTGE